MTEFEPGARRVPKTKPLVSRFQEIEQRWQDIEADIVCPLTNRPCRKTEGIKRDEKILSNSAIIFVAECGFCGTKASGWGDR